MARKLRAIGYVRVSTAEQANRGAGLAIQEKAIQQHCARGGVRLVEIARDEGQSGANGLDAREGLARALGKLEAGLADVLVVYRLDRLARDLMLQETVIARLAVKGVRVLSVSEPDVDSDEPTRVLVRQVLGAIAQYEKAVIRGRMVAGRRAKMAKGGFGGGWAPYGFRVQDRELVPVPDEQKVIALIRRFAKRGQSLRDIADALDEAGYAPRRGPRWHPTMLARILARD